MENQTNYNHPIESKENFDLWPTISMQVLANIEKRFQDNREMTEYFAQESETDDGHPMNIDQYKKEFATRSIEREKQFINRVWNFYQRYSLEDRKNLVVLFDIDDTIGKVRFCKNNTYKFDIRPSFIPLIETIISHSSQIGILSSRSRDKMLDQFGHNLQISNQNIRGGNLSGLKDYIDYSEIHSSSEIYSSDFQKSPQEMMRKQLVQKYYTGSVEKFFALSQIQQNSSKKYVLIDDIVGLDEFLDDCKNNQLKLEDPRHRETIVTDPVIDNMLHVYHEMPVGFSSIY